MKNKYDLELLNSIYEYLKVTENISDDQLWVQAFNDFLGHSYSGNYHRIKDLASAKEDLIEFAGYDPETINSAKNFEELKSILISNPNSYDDVESSLQRIYGQNYQIYLKNQILDFVKNYEDDFYDYYDDLASDGGIKTYEDQTDSFFKTIASNIDAPEYEKYIKNQWKEILPEFYEPTLKIAQKEKNPNWSQALFDIYLEFEQYDVIPQEIKDEKIIEYFGNEKVQLLQQKYDEYWKERYSRYTPKIEYTNTHKKR